MHRIVSLLPSGTEIVAALGFADCLVGRSHECVWPASVVELPICSEPRIDIHASSLEIDRQVKQSLRDALSIYRVHADALQRLAPTHIITQTQCEVCAVSLQDVESAVCQLVGSLPQIVSLNPMQLADVFDDILRVAAALGAADVGREYVAGMQARLTRLRAAASQQAIRPTVACIEWIEPLMSAGNWVPELIQIAGGEQLLGQVGKHSPWMSWDDLRAADPDVIVIMPCGFSIERTVQELPLLASHQFWPELKAVRSGRVCVTDGHQYFNRPGPRLVESAEMLAEMLHGSAFDFGHRGVGWQAVR